MADWLHGLSAAWLAVVVFGAMLGAAAVILIAVIALARGRWAAAFTAVSPGLLPPMGLLFGLVIGFLAAQVWTDHDRAQLAVNREASTLRAAVLLSDAFPGAPKARLQDLIRRQIEHAATVEWPAMAKNNATLTVIPRPLAAALRLALGLHAATPGKVVAQREMVTSLEDAFDARRQRIILSESSVNWVKWVAVILLAVLTLIAIAMVHSGNRRATAIAMALFAAGAAACVMMIAVEDRPFSGPFRVRPTVLVQVEPPVQTSAHG